MVRMAHRVFLGIPSLGIAFHLANFAFLFGRRDNPLGAIGLILTSVMR